MLNLYRRVAPLIMEVNRGAEIRGPDAIAAAAGPSCKRVRGQILGLIGFGRIGIATARRAKTFGFDVRFYDPYVRDGVDKATNVTREESLTELLESSDCISLHCNCTEENKNIINATTLASFKKGAFLVNTARGDLINEADLAQALKSGHLAGASLDVHCSEPFIKGKGPLGSAPNLLCTPHSAWYSA